MDLTQIVVNQELLSSSGLRQRTFYQHFIGTGIYSDSNFLTYILLLFYLTAAEVLTSSVAVCLPIYLTNKIDKYFENPFDFVPT